MAPGVLRFLEYLAILVHLPKIVSILFDDVY